MSDLNNYGKKAEAKIKEWLNKPEEGFCLDRLPDQMTGLYGSCNICDFTLYRFPYFYYLESKATTADRFDFSMITDYQKTHMYEKSKIEGVKSYIIVLFIEHKRAFMLDIRDIVDLESKGTKSLNIKKLEKWPIPHIEIKTIPSRKVLLDYDFESAKEIFKTLHIETI